MIKKIILFAGILNILSANAQTENTASQTPIKRTLNTQLPASAEPKPLIIVKSSSKTTTISKRAGEEQQVHNEEYYSKQLLQVNNNISAIDEKINFVNNNPEEKKIAEDSNWFESMAKIRTELLQKKQEIEDKLSNSKK